LDRGFGIIRKNYGVTVSKGKLSEEQARSCLGRISRTTEYSDLEESDIIIEAVFEDIGLKKRVFSKLDETCNPGAILATNTSYQDVDEIAQATGRPGSVLGLHFFSPANVMKLLEVVRGEATSDDVLATAMGLARTIGKIPVLSGVCYGFIGNRMLRSYGREAQLCLIEGATPSQIDGAMQKFGMAMGPLAVYDLAGLDVGHRARQALADEHKGDPRAFYVVDTLVEQGRFGQKTGAGYYRYDPNSRARLDDPEVMDIVVEQAAKHGIERRTIEDDEIVARMVYALANEGAKILAEGIAQRPGDIDVAWVFGYGFPVARGGPMHYADQVGLETVYQAVCRFRELHGECNWSPAPLLQQLATEGGTFAEWEA
jgi:3-hydroxyacyl-CoA dehydrogenase